MLEHGRIAPSFGEVRVMNYHADAAPEATFVGYAHFLRQRSAPATELGPCTRRTTPASKVEILEAGESFDLHGPNGDLRLLEDDGFYFGQDPSGNALWASNGTYTFATSGGSDVSSFSGTIETPAEIEISSPDLSAPTIVVDRSDDLIVEWTPSTHPDDEVQIDILQTDDFVLTYELACTFEDDGNAVIESSWFFESEPGVAGLFIARNRLHVQEADVDVFLSGSVAYDRGIILD